MTVKKNSKTRQDSMVPRCHSAGSKESIIRGYQPTPPQEEKTDKDI